MRTIVDQTLASTNVDAQGERLSRTFLQHYCSSMGNRRHPIHHQHDMSRPTVGYVENHRLVPDEANLGEWKLIGNVYLHDGVAESDARGFSISGVEMLLEPPTADAKLLLPYPHYNDQALIDAFTSDSRLAVGRWIKKGSGELEWGLLFGSLFAFVFTPIWDDLYKRKIAPRIDALLTAYLKNARPRGLSAQVLQVVDFHESEVQVLFIPSPDREDLCLRSDKILDGLRLVEKFLREDRKASDVGVHRIVLFFNESISGYALHRIEYSDASVEHVV